MEKIVKKITKYFDFLLKTRCFGLTRLKIKDLNKSRNDPCLDVFIKSVEISERGILR